MPDQGRLDPQQLEEPRDFIFAASKGTALLAIALLAPFSLNNFLQGRWMLGVGSLSIVLILLAKAWFLIYRQRYLGVLTMGVLFPVLIGFLTLAIVEQGLVALFWCFPAVLAFYFLMPERAAWLANLALLLIVVWLVWDVLPRAPAIRMVASLTMVSFMAGIFVHVIRRQERTLHLRAVTDVLTGLLNRMTLHASMDAVIARFEKDGCPAALLAVDLDHFKRVNDEFGHDTGDQVLRRVAQLLQKTAGPAAKAFRTGGEEFLLLLHDTSAGRAYEIADALCEDTRTARLIEDYQITLSVGVAGLQPGEDWESWMQRADRKLYEAKQAGRNCAVA